MRRTASSYAPGIAALMHTTTRAVRRWLSNTRIESVSMNAAVGVPASGVSFTRGSNTRTAS